MGRKGRRERAEKRETYAAKHAATRRKNMMIAIGVLGAIAVIVGYAGWVFVTNTEQSVGGPPGSGALGSAHDHAAILVKIFGDTFDFSAPAYQLQSPWIHFEGNDGTTVHKHADGVTMGYLFETLSIGLDDQCFVFQNGREFCSNEEYKLRFFINGEPVPDIRDYEISEDDRILISYGAGSQEELQAQLDQLETQALIKI